MKLENILLEQIRVENEQLLESISHDLLPQQRYIVEGIYRQLEPLIEASLTADQIKGLFGEIEKQSVAGGKSRTLVGGATDVVKKANEIINDTGKWLQNTAPVKNFDQKFEDLKSKASEKFPDISNKLSSLGDWAKENPGKTAAVVGILTAIASLAGGPVGGAIAGQVLRGTVELLKGEKLSTAIGKGVKTAAFGFIAGKAFEMLGDWLGGLRADVVMRDEFADVSWNATKTVTAPGMEWTRNIQGINIQVLPDDAQTINFLMDTIGKGGNQAVQAFDKLARLAAEIRTDDYRQLLQDVGAMARDNDSLYQVIQGAKEGLQAASQGAVAAAGVASDGKKTAKQENYYIQKKPLSEGQVYILFDRVENLSKVEIISEGPMDLLKKGASAVGKGLSWAGKQATEKITSAKLLASWKLEGSPTDSKELAKFLQGQGVEDSVIDASYSTMNLPKPADAADTTAEKEPAAASAQNFEPGQTVTYTNAKGEVKQATVVKQLDTVDAQGDPQIQLKSGAATFAVDRDRIQAATAQAQTDTGDQYQQAVSMIDKLPAERKARLLKALLKNTAAAQQTATA
jgi:hypothetical protein